MVQHLYPHLWQRTPLSCPHCPKLVASSDLEMGEIVPFRCGEVAEVTVLLRTWAALQGARSGGAVRRRPDRATAALRRCCTLLNLVHQDSLSQEQVKQVKCATLSVLQLEISTGKGHRCATDHLYGNRQCANPPWRNGFWHINNW